MLPQPNTLLRNRYYTLGLARAFDGAAIFGLSLLLTMEMWSLGLSIHPARMVLFLEGTNPPKRIYR